MLGKALKAVLNLPRPGLAPKADSGMPSSHALSLGYLATAAAAALLQAPPAALGEQGAAGTAAVLQVGALVLTWLRVALGFHTVPQARPSLPAPITHAPGTRAEIHSPQCECPLPFPSQVVVGFILGVAVALGWHALGSHHVLPRAAAHPQLWALLRVVSAAAVALFALQARRWYVEARQRLLRADER